MVHRHRQSVTYREIEEDSIRIYDKARACIGVYPITLLSDRHLYYLTQEHPDFKMDGDPLKVDSVHTDLSEDEIIRKYISYIPNDIIRCVL